MKLEKLIDALEAKVSELEELRRASGSTFRDGGANDEAQELIARLSGHVHRLHAIEVVG